MFYSRPRKITLGDMAMPTFVPGFTHDVLRKLYPCRQWEIRPGGRVGRDTRRIPREGLPQKLGRGQPDIWRDRRLSSNEPFPEAIP